MPALLSRNRRPILALLLLPIILAASASSLKAEPLTDADIVEVDSLDIGADAVEPPAPLLPVTVPAPGSVSITATSELPVDNFGILTPEKSGFAPDAWNGTSYSRAIDLVDGIPLELQSRSLRSLIYRLLAAEITAPPKDTDEESLLESRIRVMFMLGEGEKALAMIEALPAPMISDAIRQVKVEALLLKPDIGNACVDVKKAIESFDTHYWQRMVIFCQAHANNFDGAKLGLNLLREQNRTPEDYFLGIIGSFAEPQTPLELPEDFSVIDSAMLLATGRQDIISKHLDTLAIPALLATSADARFEPDLQVRAAEHATAKGASARALVDIYTALSARKKDERPEMVELYRRLTRERSLSQKLERTVTLVDHFTKQQARAGAYALLHFVVRETAARPQVKEMQADFLFHALNVLWLGNMEREAESLIKRLKGVNSTTIDTELYTEIADGMKALSAESAPLTGLLAKAMGSVSDVTPPRDAAHALRLLAVLSALGYNMGENLVISPELFAYSKEFAQPSAELVTEFNQAVAARRPAEAVLLATQLMGNTPLEKLSDDTIRTIVSGFHALGLETEARTFAREAVIYSPM